jgi:hypothetical protein
MAHNNRISAGEQGLIDLATECMAATTQKITAFMTACATSEMDNSTENRMAKNEAVVVAVIG